MKFNSALWLAGLSLMTMLCMGWGYWQHGKTQKKRRIPVHWPLHARVLVNRDELRVWRWLSATFNDHHVMIKMPVTRFTRPNASENVRYLYDLLKNTNCTFSVCTADGHVVGCIDMPKSVELRRITKALKENLLAQCGISYIVVNPERLPSPIEMRNEILGEDAARVRNLKREEAAIEAARVKAMIYGFRGNPMKVEEWAAGRALKAQDLLSKFETRNLGGNTDTMSFNPVTGQAETVNSMQNTQSPDNKASVSVSHANAAPPAVASATRDGATIKTDRDTEMKVADDCRAQSKSFKEVCDSYGQITSALDKATTSPAATLAAATNFMKLLAPDSVVRESELGMALQVSGEFDRATNYFNTLQRGKVLTPIQVQDFKAIAGRIYAAQAGQKAVDRKYTKVAETYGLRPGTIVQKLGQNDNGKAKPRGNTFNVMSDPASYGGKWIQAPDGKVYKSNGKK